MVHFELKTNGQMKLKTEPSAVYTPPLHFHWAYFTKSCLLLVSVILVDLTFDL